MDVIEFGKAVALTLSVPLQLFILAWCIVIDRRTTRTETKLDIALKNGKNTTHCSNDSEKH